MKVGIIVKDDYWVVEPFELGELVLIVDKSPKGFDCELGNGRINQWFHRESIEVLGEL